MVYLTDILSALIWVLCTVAPWLLAFYLISAVMFVFKGGKACTCPRLWHAISGENVCASGTQEGSGIWKALQYGLDTLPSASFAKMLMGMLLAAGILLTVPWDYTFYQEHLLIEALEFLMLLLLAILMRLPLCASASGALALLVKGFSPGLALLFMFISPASIFAYGEREAGVSLFAHAKKAASRLLLIDVPLVLLYFVLGFLFPSIRFAGRQDPPVLGLSVASQICGAVLCAIMLRIAMRRLLKKRNAKASK